VWVAGDRPLAPRFVDAPADVLADERMDEAEAEAPVDPPVTRPFPKECHCPSAIATWVAGERPLPPRAADPPADVLADERMDEAEAEAAVDPPAM